MKDDVLEVQTFPPEASFGIQHMAVIWGRPVVQTRGCLGMARRKGWCEDKNPGRLREDTWDGKATLLFFQKRSALSTRVCHLL